METNRTKKNSFFAFLIIVLAIIVLASIGSHFFKSSIEAQAAPIQIDQWITSPPPSQSDLNGRVYVVEFWATWCPPCVQSIPHLIELANKYKDVPFITISLDRSSEPVKKIIQSKGINYYVGMDNGLSEKYSVHGIPSAFVIDRNGQIAWRGHSMNPGFETTIVKALNAPPSENSNTEE